MRRFLRPLVLLVALAVGSDALARQPFVRGDANLDGTVDVSDAVRVLLSLFSGVRLLEPIDASDVDDDGAVLVSDAIYLLATLFAAGPPPAQPFPGSGLDLTMDDPFRVGDFVTPPPIAPPLPDWVVREITVDAGGLLSARVVNEGDADSPAGVGMVEFRVDGVLVDVQPLDAIVGDVCRSRARLRGVARRISARVDPDDEIVESGEFQNSVTRTIDAPPVDGPNLVISRLDLTAEDTTLEIEISNVGSAATPPQCELRIEFLADEGAGATFERTLGPRLAPTERVVISRAAPTGERFEARLEVVVASNDVDNTDNVRVAWLPSQSGLARLGTLLEDARVEAAIAWQDASGLRHYSDWTDAERRDLEDTFLSIEAGAPRAEARPPELLAGGTISADDAWTIYLEHVALSLHVEARELVSWSIRDLSDLELAYLLDARKLFQFSGGIGAAGPYRFATGLLGSVTASSPRVALDFLREQRILRETQLGTVYAFTTWMRGHLIHTSTSDVFLDQFGYEGLPPVDKVLYSLEGYRHKTAGCWGTTGLFAAVLRSVNIPVISARTTLGCCSHSRPEFPTIDRSMPHGDDPYTTYLLSSGAPVPTPRLFYSLAEMRERFLDPDLDCGESGCNSVGEQASFQSGRDKLRTAVDFLGDFLLHDYARHGPEHLDDTLRGSRVGGDVVEYAKPFFTADERAVIIGLVVDRLRELGGGDLSVGVEIVLRRVSRYGANK